MKLSQLMTGYNPYHWEDIGHCVEWPRAGKFSSGFERKNRKVLRVKAVEYRRWRVLVRIERLSKRGKRNRWGLFDRYY